MTALVPCRTATSIATKLARFDQFLDSHRETAKQLRHDPSLVDNRQYLKDHPALQSYLEEHPAIREEIRENPDAFMRAENRYDRREDHQDLDRGRERELANFDQFLDSHRETAEQLRKNPSLASNQQFLKEHQAKAVDCRGMPPEQTPTSLLGCRESCC
jgi:hypothetical protein